MIHYEELEVKNFCQHSERAVVLNTGITGVTGDMGVGKTNFIYNGLLFGMTGDTPPLFVKGDFVKDDATSGYVQIRFSTTDASYLIHRALGNGKTYLEKDGNTLAEGITSVNEHIEDILKIPIKLFKIISFIPQGQLNAYILQDHSTRMSFFQTLANISISEKLRNIYQKYLSELPSVIPQEEAIKELNIKIESFEKLSKTTLQDLKDNNKILKGFKDQEYYYKLMNSEIKEEVQDNINKLNEAILQQEAKKAQLNIPEEPFKIIVTDEERELNNAVDVEKKRKEDLKNTQNSLDTLIEKGKTLRTITTEASKKLGLKKEILEKTREDYILKKPKKDLLDAKICPTCSKAFDEKDIQSAFGMSKEQFLQEFEVSFKKGIELKKSIETLENKQATDMASLQQITTQWKATNEQLRLLSIVPKNIEEINNFNKEIFAQKKIQQETYLNYVSLKENVESTLKAIETNKAQYIAQINVLKEKSTISKEAHNEAKNHFSQLQDLLNKKNELSSQKDSNKQSLEIFKEQLEDLKEKQIKYKEVHAKFKYIESARDAMHRDAIPKHVLRAIRKSFNEKLQKNMEDFPVDFALYLDDNFDLKVKKIGSVQGVHRLSGGEKASAALAYIFSIAQVFGHNSSLIVLDEPTYGFSSEKMSQLCDIFNKIKNNICKNSYMMLITHERALFPAFSKQINLKKEVI